MRSAPRWAAPRPHADRLPHRQPDRSHRPGDRQPIAVLAIGGHSDPRQRRPRRGRHQDHPGDHQQPQPAPRSRIISSPKSTTTKTWKWPGLSARTKPSWCVTGDPDRPHHRANLPPVGPFGGLHRAARLWRRRDLLQEEPCPGWQDVRPGAAAYRRLSRDGPVEPRRPASQLNPPMDTSSDRRRPGDRNFGRRRYRPPGGAAPPIRPWNGSSIRRPSASGRGPERTLILGWNRARPRDHQRAGRYVAPGSRSAWLPKTRPVRPNITAHGCPATPQPDRSVPARRHHRPAGPRGNLDAPQFRPHYRPAPTQTTQEIQARTPAL